MRIAIPCCPAAITRWSAELRAVADTSRTGDREHTYVGLQKGFGEQMTDIDIATPDETAIGVPDEAPTHRVLAEGEYILPMADDRPACTSGAWRVVVQVRGSVVTRAVTYEGARWSPAGSPLEGEPWTEVIWPTWPATVADELEASESPLQDLLQHWDVTIGRLRDSAKWLAAVIGAALASVIPTAQLGGLGHMHLSDSSKVLGTLGLLLISMTLLLVLRVLRPTSVSYADVQDAVSPPGLRGRLRGLVREFSDDSHAFESPLYRWKHTVEAHHDLYLPCGITRLDRLRQLMTVEEVTLVALSRATEDAESDDLLQTLKAAQAARAARLHELRAAAATVVAIGTYYVVRARSTLASYGGVALGLAGLLAIAASVIS